jgi:hypothetical protein
MKAFVMLGVLAAAVSPLDCEGDPPPPLYIDCPAPQTLECQDGGAVASFSPSVTGGVPGYSVSCQPPSGSFFPLGCNTSTCSASDSIGQGASCGHQVCVVDTLAPIITVKPEPVSLWAPNHEMLDFKLSHCVESVVDRCHGPLDVDAVGVIARAESDEVEDDALVDDAMGDGHTCRDIELGGGSAARLRSERQGRGNGRVYTVHFTVTDPSGNRASAACQVQVVHDQSAASAPAVRDACQYCEGTGCGTCPSASPECPVP